MTECSAFVDEQFKHYNNIMQILTCPGAGFNQFIADRLYETSWNYWASSDSKGIFDECRLTFLQDISSKVTEYNIPPELVINADQTPSSYVSVGKQTMAKKGSTSVPIKGLMDKRNITLTFSITHQCKLYILTRLKPLNPAILSFLKVFVLLRILNIGQMKKRF